MNRFGTRLLLLISLTVFGAALLHSLGGCQRTTAYGSDSLLATLPAQVDFNFHIKPILSDRCFACHGPDANKREGNLRLDTEAGAFAALDSLGKRHAIVAGDLGRSELFGRITTKDPELMMPPPNSNLKLSEAEVALLARWIDQGAKWKEHWSFTAPQKPELPVVKAKDWVKTPLDQFVLKRLEDKSLQPAPEAPKETLLRRAAFDLTGLPPGVAEVDAFLKDTSPDAYEKAVDRLLASPHYGERMAVEWLDLARYADSHGYQDDGMRNSWPWREWVINAYNRNLPYDRFITWQLAGDLMPEPTKDQLLATSFNRNHSQTQEGGVVDEEYRVEYVADRTNTFGKAFLGLTVECARCHDHKYDPISQKDYYSLSAFFNNNHDAGIIPYNGEASPTLILPDSAAEEKLKFLREQIAPLEKTLQPATHGEPFERWLADAEKSPEAFSTRPAGLLGWFAFEEPQKEEALKNKVKGKLKGKITGDLSNKPVVVEGKRGKARKFIGDAGMEFTEELNFDRHQPFSLSIWVNVLKEGEQGMIMGKSNGEFEGFRGYRLVLNKNNTLSVSLSYVWPANCIDLMTTNKLTTNRWHHVALTYDGSSQASGVQLFLDGREAPRTVLADNLHKSLLYGEKKTNWYKRPFEMGTFFQGSIRNVAVDEFMAYSRQLAPAEVKELSGENGYISGLLRLPRTQRTDAQTRDLFGYYLLNFDQAYARQLAALTKLRDEENQLLTDQPEVMIMQERPVKLPTYLLDRGAYDAPKERVNPNTPAKLVAFDRKQPANRLGLARWLLDKNHPLTSRVTVNRFWAMCFGKGLVSTVDDFGNQGTMPTHPELLDFLAVQLMESGWDVKAFMKMLVTSATYRQSSVPSPPALAADPDNALLSRGPSFRLSAEQIRDNALAASGLLVRKIGGPSVYPYQPAGIWEALATRNATSYKQGEGDDLYRRSLYTVWKRSSPPPSMMNFDAPDRYLCVVKRQKTATPLQSLVLMNDPQFVEAARKLAERMMREGGDAPEARISYAYKALTSRAPRPGELNLLKQLYSEELTDFAKDPKKIKELLQTGASKWDTSLPPAELAACTMVATTVMNFDEFVMKR